MDALFAEREDGQVDIDLGPDRRLLSEALNDCISSLPPRGAGGKGPSTYWIEVTETGLSDSLVLGTERPFIWGNITLLRLKGDQVEARYDFDEDDIEGQFLDIQEFRRILSEWRDRIQDSASRSVAPLPEIYRRNPMQGHPVISDTRVIESTDVE